MAHVLLPFDEMLRKGLLNERVKDWCMLIRPLHILRNLNKIAKAPLLLRIGQQSRTLFLNMRTGLLIKRNTYIKPV